MAEDRFKALLGKIAIRGTLECVTGLHIGASKEALDIGGIDAPHPTGFVPQILLVPDLNGLDFAAIPVGNQRHKLGKGLMKALWRWVAIRMIVSFSIWKRLLLICLSAS